MKLISTTLLFLLVLAFNAQEKKEPFCIGESVTMHSEILNEERIINVFIPDSYYTDSTRKYPVVYVLDGTRNEDFMHIVGMLHFTSFPWLDITPSFIVVGISNIDRKRDFTFPTTVKRDKRNFPTTGGSEKFINYMEKELQPYVLSHYRTDSTSTLIGQSLGGLLASEVVYKKPEMFDQYIIVSPSLWWDKESLLKLEPKAYTGVKTIYVGGGVEGEVMERTAKELHQKLDETKTKDTRVFYDFLADKDHANIMHQAVYNAFLLFYAKEEKESKRH